MRLTRFRPAGPAPARRRLPPWRRPVVRAAAAGLALAALALGGWQAWRLGLVASAWAQAERAALAGTAAAGLAVEEVYLEGRRLTPLDEVLAALEVRRGAPILAVDPAEARRRLEGLGWVSRASVERRLPNVVHVRIVEQQPLALWQHQGRLALIDREGVVILRRGVERFADLPILVGAEAPAAAAALIDEIAAVAGLADIVEAAIHVSGRRWNLRLKGDIEVRLPEEDVGAALARLGQLRQKDGLLERDIIAVDLRQPDRLIVRLGPAARKSGNKI